MPLVLQCKYFFYGNCIKKDSKDISECNYDCPIYKLEKEEE